MHMTVVDQHDGTGRLTLRRTPLTTDIVPTSSTFTDDLLSKCGDVGADTSWGPSAGVVYLSWSSNLSGAPNLFSYIDRSGQPIPVTTADQSRLVDIELVRITAEAVTYAYGDSRQLTVTADAALPGKSYSDQEGLS